MPLYLQVVEGYKRLILNGVIAENEKLPSVRELASMLAINPNTIQRAYRELEIEGFVGTSPGKGIFAVGGDNLKQQDIEDIFKDSGSNIKKLLDYGLSFNEIINQLEKRFNQKEAGGDSHDIDE